MHLMRATPQRTPLQFPHPVPRIQACNLVGFRERRIVEGVFYEIFDRALEVQHGLADVDAFGGPSPAMGTPSRRRVFSEKIIFNRPP